MRLAVPGVSLLPSPPHRVPDSSPPYHVDRHPPLLLTAPSSGFLSPTGRRPPPLPAASSVGRPTPPLPTAPASPPCVECRPPASSPPRRVVGCWLSASSLAVHQELAPPSREEPALSTPLSTSQPTASASSAPSPRGRSQGENLIRRSFLVPDAKVPGRNFLKFGLD
jgi:hypothetical protein